MPGYRDVAEDLRRRIVDGEFPPGSGLPKIADLMEHYSVARQTVRSAIKELETSGYLRQRLGKGQTPLVLDMRPVRIPLSRYSRVLEPGGQRGPWETACAEQGVDGRMVLAGFERDVPADSHVAKMLGIAVGDPTVYRRRHAMIGERVHHVQHVWYAADLVEGTALAEPGKVIGGAFGLLTGMGHPPEMLDEWITARMPTREEAKELSSGTGIPLVVVERTVRDHGGRVLELMRLIAPSDQVELHYDALPLTRK